MSSENTSNERAPQAPAIEQTAGDRRGASAEDNRVAARRWIHAFNTRDDEGEADSRTPDYVAHAPASIHSAVLDGDAWIEFLAVFLEGFPDLHIEVQDSAADEEMVAQRILFTGTHTGPFRGLPPTNRQVRFSGLEINRMIDGKIAEHWFQLDAVTLFEQLGLRVIPGPRLLLRLMASPVKRLFATRRRTVRS
jgi:predicted ester cyclase